MDAIWKGPDGTACQQVSDSLTGGLTFYFLTTLIVLAGVWLGTEYVHQPDHERSRAVSVIEALGNWDGGWYAQIATEGYFYKPGQISSLAFFPAYPLLASVVMRFTGLSAENALILVSHCCLLGTFVVLSAYVRRRFVEAPLELSDYTLLALGLWPTTMFFRMAYTEALFLFLMLLTMYGMERNWRAWGVAVIIGAVTATRPVGVALLAPFALCIWRTRKTKTAAVYLGQHGERSELDESRPAAASSLLGIARAGVLMIVACWGLMAYMLYQYLEFGDPLVFLKTQDHWSVRRDVTFWENAGAVLTLEPAWSVYVPSSFAYWARHEDFHNPLFSLHFANPVYFLVTTGLVALGGWKGWLNERELALAALLLLIPYVSHSYRAVMMAQGRYAAAVFPAYLVLGQLAWRAPPPLAAIGCAFAGFLLGSYSALFAAWHAFI